MSTQAPGTSRQIAWPSVITVISAAILIGEKGASLVLGLDRPA